MHIRKLITHLESLAAVNGDLDIRIATEQPDDMPEDERFTYEIVPDAVDGIVAIGGPDLAIACLATGRKIMLGED